MPPALSVSGVPVFNDPYSAFLHVFRTCDVFSALRPAFFDQLLPTNESQSTPKKLAHRRPWGKAFWHMGHGLRPEVENALVEVVEPTVQTSVPLSITEDDYGHFGPSVTTQRAGPMLRVNNWVSDNPDRHANMTICAGSCLDKRAGADDPDRCANSCLEVSDCLRYASHYWDGQVTIAPTAHTEFPLTILTTPRAAGLTTTKSVSAIFSMGHSCLGASSMAIPPASTLTGCVRCSMPCHAATVSCEMSTVMLICVPIPTFPKSSASPKHWSERLVATPCAKLSHSFYIVALIHTLMPIIGKHANSARLRMPALRKNMVYDTAEWQNT